MRVVHQPGRGQGGKSNGQIRNSAVGGKPPVPDDEFEAVMRAVNKWHADAGSSLSLPSFATILEG